MSLDLLLPLALLGAFVVLLLALLYECLPRARAVTVPFWCPVRQQNATVQAVFKPGGRPVGVVRCSAFTPPTAIRCDRTCLRLPYVVTAADTAPPPSRADAG